MKAHPTLRPHWLLVAWLTILDPTLPAQTLCPLAETALLGPGTPGAAGVPQLLTLGLPAAGNPLPSLAIAAGPPFAVVQFVLGSLGQPTPLRRYGAQLFPATPLLRRVSQLDAQGQSAPWSLGPGALSPSACGLQLVLQGIVADGSAQGGLAFTPGWRLTAGLGSAAASLMPWPAYRLGSQARGAPGVGDLDGDGRSDVVLNTGQGSSSALEVLRQLADGTLASPLVTPTTDLGASSAVVFADRDGDGVLDLTAAIVGPAGPQPGLVSRRGLGDGSFGAARFQVTAQAIGSLALGDMNGDGFTDVVVSPWNPFALAVIPGAPGLNLGTPLLTPLAGLSSASRLALGDVNLDGSLDVLITLNGPTLALLPGHGDGSLGAAVSAPLPLDSATSLALGDVQGDGWPDALVGGVANSIVSIAVFAGDGSGELANAVTTPAFQGSSGDVAQLALGDVDEDGADEVFLAGLKGVWISGSSGGGSLNTPNQLVGGNSVALADMDADGHLDLVTTTFLVSEFWTSWYGGSGDGNFAVPQAVPGFLTALPTRLADTDGDGDLDAAGVLFDGTVTRILNDGSGHFGTAQTVDLAGAARDLAAADLDGDGTIDLMVTHAATTSASLGLARGLGNGSFAPAVTIPLPAAPDRLRLHDIDRDGRLDTVLTTATSGAVLLLTLPTQPNGVPGAPMATASRGSTPLTSFQLADLDGDGLDDIIAQSGQGLTLCPGTATPVFGAPAVVPGTATIAPALLPIGVGDMDGDGDLDVIGQHWLEGLTLFVNDGSGGLTKVPNAALAFSSTEPLCVDVNLDGVLDVVADRGLWLGIGGGNFAPWQAASPSGGASGDIDDDGDPDFFNFGVLMLNGLK